MSTGPKLTFLERTVATLMETMSQRMAGFSPPFIREVVHAYGIRGAFRRLSLMGDVVTQLEKELGMCEAHVLVGYASLWNGCYYCALGHLFITNLIYFRDTGELYPLDERVVATWLDGRDSEILDHTQNALAGEAHSMLRGLLTRQVELKWGRVNVENRTDELIELSIVAYDWFNHCTIVAPEDEIVALNELAKEHELQRRYLDARMARSNT